MPSLWDRFSGWVNEHILGKEEEAEEEEQYPPPIQPPEYGEDVEYPEEPYDFGANDPIHIQDEFGDHGTKTYEEWYQDSLLSSREFHDKYGDDWYNLDIIDFLEDYYDIDWDWESWRTAYEEAQ